MCIVEKEIYMRDRAGNGRGTNATSLVLGLAVCVRVCVCSVCACRLGKEWGPVFPGFGLEMCLKQLFPSRETITLHWVLQAGRIDLLCLIVVGVVISRS